MGGSMRLGVAAIFCVSLLALPAFAQQPAPREAVEPKDEMVTRKNAWTVGLISGQLEGLYPRFAAEMQKVLDDKDELRVMPILAYGAASNVDDLLYTKGVDVAFTQADVLLHFRTERNIPNLAERLHYISALYSTEVHILARPEIATIQDLKGKKVSFGPVGNSASLTGPIVFDRLKIKVNRLNFDHTTGLEKLKAGEVDAVVRVIGKPAGDTFKVPKDSGLHFLSISYDDASKNLFDDVYSLGELTHKDYPDLIPEGKVIDTVSVTTVLAVYNWPKSTDRFRRVERFTRYFFDRFDRFLAPGFHPKWKEVNLSQPVPGWTRFSTADQMLKQMKPVASAATASASAGDTRRDFNTFMENRPTPRTPAETDALFKEFLSWREKSPAPAPASAPR
jgi:TRAP-type uncharacterized transport system substrate-binding protein